MKKLLFLLLIVAGTFMTQAQDDSIKRFRFKASSSSSSQDRTHWFSEDLGHCSSNVIDARTIETFTWNATTGVLALDGSPIGTPITGRRASGFTNLFAGTYNEVQTTNGRGGFVSRLIYNEATDSWD